MDVEGQYGTWDLHGNLVKEIPTIRYPITSRQTGRKALIAMIGASFGSTPMRGCDSVPIAIGGSII